MEKLIERRASHRKIKKFHQKTTTKKKEEEKQINKRCLIESPIRKKKFNNVNNSIVIARCCRFIRDTSHRLLPINT